MKTYVLSLSATEILRLLRAEIETAHGAPELDVVAPETEYLVKKHELITSITVLRIEPRVESGYWILETVIERDLRPTSIDRDDKLVRKQLTLSEFEAELQAPGRKRVTVRLQVQTAAVRRDFDRWLAGMRARHFSSGK